VDAVPDTTPPALTIGSPQTRSYLHSDALTIEIAATDAGSGLAPDSPSARLDGTTVANGQAVSLLTLSLGSHVLTMSASDVAGNFAQQSATFTIVATIDSVIEAVNTLAAQGKLNASSQKTLSSKLSDVRAALARGNATAARNKLRDAIDYAETQSDKGIAPAAASLLVADMQYVLGTF
jgi:cytochrome c